MGNVFNRSKKVGLGIIVLQLIASATFLVSLCMLNVLDVKFVAFIGTVVFLVFFILALAIYLAKNRAILRKATSIVVSIILFAMSFLMFTMNSAVDEIVKPAGRVETMHVVVLKDDPAQTIQDAKDYKFGVQYQFKGEEVRETVKLINEELDKEIKTKKYESVHAQAEALFKKKAGAIIYNDAYTGMLEELYEGYSEKVRILYSYEVAIEAKEIVLNEVVKEEKKDRYDDTFTMFISGIDVYGNINRTSRSDVNILAVVNKETHQILLVTTPRDYYVKIPGISGDQRDKLTHAGIYGVNASMATLSELYDVNIDYYTRVNFTSVINIIDALGGVTVHSDYAFSNSVVNIKKGDNYLNGEQALAFSRERYNLPGGDFQRGKNQQEVIKGVLEKAISPKMLSSAGDILKIVSYNIDSNLDMKEVKDIIKDQIKSNEPWEVKTMAAVGHGDSQKCYSSPGYNLYVAWPDADSIEQISKAIDKVENNQMLDGSDTVQ